jgi:hypothetical protein
MILTSIRYPFESIAFTRLLDPARTTTLSHERYFGEQYPSPSIIRPWMIALTPKSKLYSAIAAVLARFMETRSCYVLRYRVFGSNRPRASDR